jgi:hypothetical protein
LKKVAIVGSEEKYWTSEQRTKAVVRIRDCLMQWSMRPAINSMDDLILVSGGCPKGGVDIWAEIVADVLGIGKEIYSPKVYQWEDGDHVEYIYKDVTLKTKEMVPIHIPQKGYKTRNIEIAETCDVLYCIDPKGRDWSGGRWTMEYAKKLGKETHLVEIE